MASARFLLEKYNSRVKKYIENGIPNRYTESISSVYGGIMNNYSFKVTGVTVGGFTKTFTPAVREHGDEIRLVIPREALSNPRMETLRVESTLTTAHVGDAGYMFYPTNFYYGFALTRFDEKPDTLFKTWPTATLVCGFACESERAVFVHIRGEAFDGRFEIEVKNGVYTVTPQFRFDGDEPDEDVEIVYTRMPGADYSAMARAYRQYQLDFCGCVPLRKRAALREPLRRAADGMELRIRMGWKPIPTPVRHQNLANEPEMFVACDVERLNKIVDRMQAKGIDKAEICLVGWGPGGHDGRFPQQYPSDERFGGDEALRAFIAKAQRLGYQVVCHTVSCGAYEIADNFDRDLLTKKKNACGDPEPYIRDHYKKDGLNGGEPYHLCARTAWENYVTKDFPKVRGYGFEGLHYNDELTAIIPEKCYDKNHPVSRKDAWDYHRKVAAYCRDLFGGFQSEGYMDYMNEYLDAALYIGVQSKLNHDQCALFDEGIPFWQLVYHGIILSNPTSQTVNYPVKEEYQHLKFLEYGGRPVMYFYSKFGADRNWMGDLDLHCADDADIERAVDAIKVAYDEYEKYKHLQYEFMENHEKLAEGVYRTTYSDGTVFTVDYNRETYTVTKA